MADHKLGGISATISAFESLHIRGYDLDAVLSFQEGKYQNHEYLEDYFKARGISFLSIDAPPPMGATSAEDHEAMSYYYETMSKVDQVEETLHDLSEKHNNRIQNLDSMATRAHTSIWYPFTQHREVSPNTILTIDSASGDFFQAHNFPPKAEEISIATQQPNVLEPTFDGSASWWTQGLGHGNPELALAAAYASGRYGHVMFAGTVHEPALLLAENLLKNLQNQRMSKVFFSDNGSTGMEVGVKMALTASMERYKWDVPKSNVGVIGLKGSYHGDTIGAMDCSEPSTYNEKVHWYNGRGYWFDFPAVKSRNGKWEIDIPSEMAIDSSGSKLSFDSISAVFDLEVRKQSPQAKKYESYINNTLEKLVGEGKTFGALIMEPVILGAGGMLMADPLFQATLCSVVRSSSSLFSPGITPSSSDPHAWTGLPILFDEVFTGLYRLGRFSSGSFLKTHPDISVHAKLLTGGLVPLCCTVASESIYNTFLGAEKRDALLHGHSYTAHAVGAHVANVSIDMMRKMEGDGSWEGYREDWKEEGRGGQGVWSVWGKGFVGELSGLKGVDSVVALGSVLAVTMEDEVGGEFTRDIILKVEVNADGVTGYNSTAAIGLRTRLMEGSKDGFRIHSRVLGNVLYLMASQTTKSETLRTIEKLLVESI